MLENKKEKELIESCIKILLERSTNEGGRYTLTAPTILGKYHHIKFSPNKIEVI